MYLKLNKDQKKVVDKIIQSADSQTLQNTAGLESEELETNCFFVDGPGGTGKTFVYNTVYYLLTGMGKKVSAVAWTGIAANLLPNGRTVHNQFGLPVPLTDESTSRIKPNSAAGRALKEIDVFIWDEASMAPSSALNSIDILLRDTAQCQKPFGGKIFVLGGDFRQVLPVVRFGSRTRQVASSIKSSPLWKNFDIMTLHKNMRAKSEEQQFAHWLLELGNGKIKSDSECFIDIPPNLRCTEQLSKDIFPSEVLKSEQNICNSAILCPKNESALLINEEVLKMLPGEEVTYTSIDMVRPGEEQETDFPVEFLNSQTPSGMPPHKLTLKVGAVVMCLRNLNISGGLCNGTRMVVTALRDHVVQCKIATGLKRGETVLIPRISTLPSDPFFPVDFVRRQFPLRLAYCMTINKAQGQTFDRIGLYLPEPVFSHGQLYVALSRVRSADSIALHIVPPRGRNDRETKNIVYTEIL